MGQRVPCCCGRVGWAAAARTGPQGPVPESRKVRTSQSRVIANSNPRRLAGQCHRKQTATLVVVRVKRCGKSAPAFRVTGVARQTPPEARSRRPHRKVRSRRRSRAARPSLRVGRLRHPATVCPDGWSPPRRRWLCRGGGEQNPAYRPTRPPRRAAVSVSFSPTCRVCATPRRAADGSSRPSRTPAGRAIRR